MPARVEHYGVMSNGVNLYHAVCDEHPRFVRVPWSGPTVPQESVDKHNAEFHKSA